MKREMIRDFKNSNFDTLFIETKYFSYEIEKDSKSYRVTEKDKDNRNITSLYTEYKDLAKTIEGNVKWYEMR